jgi:hypothetical protein
VIPNRIKREHVLTSQLSRREAPELPESPAEIVRALTMDAPLYGWAELERGNGRPPNRAGVYAWFFRTVPPGVPTDGCRTHDGGTLLYVGISPTSSKSRENLRSRIRP